MRILSWASFLLAACSASIDAASNTSTGVLEVDLVFPQNETYAPTSVMHIIFAIQNPELAPVLSTQISFYIYNWDEKLQGGSSDGSYKYDIKWTHISSSNPYFEYRPFSNFDREGRWEISWSVGWVNCTDTTVGSYGNDRLDAHWSANSLHFTTKESAQEVDLVAATENDKCSDDMGFAFNITDTYEAPLGADWAGNDTCGLVASPLPTPDPCRVKINSAVASSISASMAKQRCDLMAIWDRTTLPADCRSDKNAAQQLLVGSFVCLMTSVGAWSFILLQRSRHG